MTLKMIDGDKPAPGQPRWLKPLLLGSLMLNLLLVGAILGGFWAARNHGGRGLASIEQGFLGYVKNLPRERSQALLAIAEPQRTTLRANRKVMRERRAAALAALTAEPFDKEALKAALTRANEAEDEMQRTGQALFIDMAERLSVAERKGYGVWRERAMGPDHAPGQGERDKRKPQ